MTQIDRDTVIWDCGCYQEADHKGYCKKHRELGQQARRDNVTTESQQVVGIVESIEIKDGVGERGDWRLHKFRVRGPAGTRSYSTFDKGWPTNIVGGKTYRFTYTQKQQGDFVNYTITNALEVDPAEFGAQPSSQGAPPQNGGVPTDEAKAAVSVGSAGTGPQPELKSPSRSFDQNQDIQRRSIERQVALKAAVEVFSGVEFQHDGTTIIDAADKFFAWLRDGADTDVKAPSKPTDANSEREPSETHPSTAEEHSDAMFGPEQPLYDANGEVVDLSPPAEEDFTAFWQRIKGPPWNKTPTDVETVLGMELAAWIHPSEGREANTLAEAWRWCIEAWRKEGAA